MGERRIDQSAESWYREQLADARAEVERLRERAERAEGRITWEGKHNLLAECERLRGELERVKSAARLEATSGEIHYQARERMESALTAGRELAEAVERHIANNAYGELDRDDRVDDALARFREATKE